MDILKEEKKCWRKGFKIIACLDEVGRGPLAGPVVVCALAVLKPKFKIPKNLKGVKDSKKLSSEKREEFYGILKEHPQIEWATSRVSEGVIDKINILEATKLAMKRAVRSLDKKLGKKINFLIIDGNFGIDLDIPQKSIIKADGKVFSVISASIIAKVTRDRIMERYHKKYPCYEFASHKGYPTKFHRQSLKKNGPCKIHRNSFGPVKRFVKGKVEVDKFV